MKSIKIKFGLSLVFALFIIVISLSSKALYLSIYHYLVMFIFVIFIVDEMLILIPKFNTNKITNKTYKSNYIEKTYNQKELNQLVIKNNIRAIIVFIAYFGSLAICGYLYLKYENIDSRFIIILFALINLGDYTCILIWCPFKEMFLKNSCCTNCRISNWDRLMKFYILLFIPSLFTIILVFLGLIIFFYWEIIHFLHPERFYSLSNDLLTCKRCDTHKCKQTKRQPN
ncbi:hypothetical protein CI105_01535 [Candidatus Izimaplasma bacterium ZiA1]|uniref:hypothetical protein n=1 Tax=Candidatus Izimoplasma sp. ZiA1 TaxID=2024899 RepID=UPI000BAA7981|nr:hypothetical protein CI105_01535 [Candidatus Izimaplasma bacterium ZiA1]